MKINKERLWNTLMELGRIGDSSDGGCRRLALSQEEGQARALLRSWAAELDLSCREDQIGNLFFRRHGTDPERRAIAFGSHIDTVHTGGKFDGAYGVIAGLEVMRVMVEEGEKTAAPLELIIWTNEEGARFSPMTMGASVFVGDIDAKFALSRTDSEGITVAEALESISAGGTDVVTLDEFDTFLEVHVEQGPLLVETRQDIGIVTGSFKVHYYVAEIIGVPSHVGPTLMEQRHDALVAASELILAVEKIGLSRGRRGRSNAPHIEVYPNARGVIPSTVRLSLDLRHADEVETEAMISELRSEIAQVESARGVKIKLDKYFEFGPIQSYDCVNDLIRQTADEISLSHRNILTVASHDSVVLMRHMRTGLFFIPSDTGISHNPEEHSTPDQCLKGAELLLNMVNKLAN